jgi:hypothetical protein
VKLTVEFDRFRKRPQTRHAPGRPAVDQDHLPFVLGDSAIEPRPVNHLGGDFTRFGSDGNFPGQNSDPEQREQTTKTGHHGSFPCDKFSTGFTPQKIVRQSLSD